MGRTNALVTGRIISGGSRQDIIHVVIRKLRSYAALHAVEGAGKPKEESE